MGLLLAAVLALAQGETATASGTLWLAVADLALGALGLPGAYLGLRGLLGRQPPKPLKLTSRVTWVVILLVFAAALGVGYLAFRDAFLPEILGPLAHVLAGASPIVLVVWLALRLGRALPLRRILGQFTAGLWVVPVVTLVLESILLVPLIVFLMLGLALAPEGKGAHRSPVFRQGCITGADRRLRHGHHDEALVLDSGFRVSMRGGSSH